MEYFMLRLSFRRVMLVPFLLLLVLGCEREVKPIKIGFVGGLTGRVAGLGISGRDGALLAVEEVNAAGGINGRNVVLVVKDDKQDPTAAKQGVAELIKEDVVAIIGHMTSSMTAVTLPLVNQAEKLMISPTSKSDLFSGKDDYLLRVTAPSSFNARKIAELACQEMGLKRFAVVYDLNNAAFTESWANQFRKDFEACGGNIAVAKGFHSGTADLSFFNLVTEISVIKPDALLVLASALDAALIMQQLKKVGLSIPVFASEWSFTSDILNYGGRAVEGLISFHSFNSSSQRTIYIEHKAKFIQRFGYEPSFASVLSYDATKLLLYGLEQNPNPAEIKQTLLGIGTFPALQADITFDKYGDVTRKLFHTVISDGQFKVVN